MKKNYKGSIFSQATSSGRKMLYYKSPYLNNKAHSTGLDDTKFNRKYLAEKLKKIEYEHETGLNEKEVNIDLYKLFNRYIKHCEENKQLQKKTIQSYIYAFNKLLPNNHKITDKVIYNNKEIYLIEQQIVKNLDNLRLSPTSKNILIRSIGTFLNWLFSEEYINTFNYKKYKLKELKKPIETFNDQEIIQILDYLEKANKKVFYVLKFMTLVGTRGKETLEIKFSDIDIVNMSLTIPNKIRKDISQTIPLPQEAIDIINLMIKQKEFRYKNKEYLFDYNISSLRYITKVLTDTMNKFGIKKNVKLHAFRKYFATQVVKSGVSPYIAQKLIRHTNIQTTINHYYSQEISELNEIRNNIKILPSNEE